MLGAQQSFAKGASLLTSYNLSLSRSTTQTSPSINGSDTLILSFDVVAGSDTGDYAADTWTVPDDGLYLITYNFSWGAGTPANADFVSPYLNLNGAGDSGADAMKRTTYYDSKTTITTTDTRLRQLSQGDQIVFEALLSSTGATTFTLVNATGRFSHVSIVKIA